MAKDDGGKSLAVEMAMREAVVSGTAVTRIGRAGEVTFISKDEFLDDTPVQKTRTYPTHNEMAEWVRDRMVEEPYWDSNRREETEEERAKRLAEDRAIHAAITRNIRGRHW